MTSLIETCDAFLKGSSGLENLREWLASNQWELEGPLEDLADSLDVAIVHFDDGYSDFDQLRQRVEAEVEKALTVRVDTVVDSLPPVASSRSDSVDETIFRKLEEVGATNVTLRFAMDLV